MVPPRSDEHDRPSHDVDDRPSPDGGTDPGFDEAALYVVVRDAVEDAILGVIGTLLLVGIGFLLVWVGATAVFETRSPAAVAVGALLALFGLYVAAATLRVIPPIREWF